jgi:hypothetical protein
MQIGNNATVTGPGSVTISVARNGGSAVARTGVLTIAGQSITVQQAGFNWAATADVNGDGYSDFLWQSQTNGALALWSVQGTSVVSMNAIPSVSDLSWKVVGTGDLNGDGHADIVWQKTDGTMAAWMWTANGFLGGGLLNPGAVDPVWRVRGVADLNGDGKADIVWQHATQGWLAAWFMNGFNATSFTLLSTPRQPDPNWLIVGAGDINGDGKADLLWQNQATGLLAAWLMIGAQVFHTSVLPLYTPDLNWKVMGVGDVEGDGFADLIWENTATGQVAVWTLYGYSIQYTRVIYAGGAPAFADLNWTMVGPG